MSSTFYLQRNVYYDATVSAYGYWAGKDPEVYTYWVNEMDFLTPYARGVVEAKLKTRKPNQQFEKMREMMKEEGFKPTAPATQPAATPTTKAATKQGEDL